MTKVNVEQKVAEQIEKILLKNEMALQPFMDRSIQGTVAAVRLVSTKQEEPTPYKEGTVSNNPNSNANNKANTGEDKASGDSNGAVGTA